MTNQSPSIEEIRQFNEIRSIFFNKPVLSLDEINEWNRLSKIVQGFDLLGITLEKIKRLEAALQKCKEQRDLAFNELSWSYLKDDEELESILEGR